MKPEMLQGLFQGMVTSSDDADRVAYARDLWPRHLLTLREGQAAGERPLGVVWPRTTEDVSVIVKRCVEEGIPLVPFGAGSGVCGGVLPSPQTVVMDLKRMKRWRNLDEDALSLDVEAGAMGITLEEDLQARGYTIGHFPSSILCSTVGGWVAARGAGQTSGRYGKIEDMVVDLEVVDGRGEIVQHRRRTHAADLSPLLIGSEGTLGVITSATFRLFPAPRARAYSSFSFASTEAGWEAMKQMFQAGLRPAVARLYDPFDAAIARMGSVKAHGSQSKSKVAALGNSAKLLQTVLRLPRALNGLIETLEGVEFGESFSAMLVIVSEGTPEEVADERQKCRRVCSQAGGKDTGEGPAQRWLKHRYSVSYRQAPTVRAGAFLDTMEVAAPWSKLNALYHNVRHALGKRAFVMAHLSHAYPDGCSIYFTFAGVGGDEGEGALQAKNAYDSTWSDALTAAVESGGTLSHHHGVGRSKAPRVAHEAGCALDLLHAVKRAYDPAGIFNPGNLLPAETGVKHPGESTDVVARASKLDVESLTLHAPATAKIRDLEAFVGRAGLTLRLGDSEGLDVSTWMLKGCPGAVHPYDDPVDHPIAGLQASLPDGRIVHLRTGPRRAVGPDWVPLAVGHDRMLSPLSVVLRVFGSNTPHPVGNLKLAREPEQNEGEKQIVAAIRRELG